MASRRELCLEEKMNLIKEKERGLSHRQFSDRFQISVGAVSNILKRKFEYTNDYETNRNKKLKRKFKDESRNQRQRLRMVRFIMFICSTNFKSLEMKNYFSHIVNVWNKFNMNKLL